MKKFFLFGAIIASVMLVATAKDFLIQLRSGEQVRLNVDKIEQVRFEAAADQSDLPDDPYPSATDFSRKMLFMDHTGTRCGNCPLMTLALRSIADDPAYSAYTLAVLHSYQGDPMGTALVREISGIYAAGQGFPFVNVNFKPAGVGAQENYLKIADNLRTLIDNERTDVIPSGVASVAKLNDDRTIDLTLAVKAAQDGEYRVGAFLLEDGITAAQTNYYEEQTGDVDFNTHNNVVRTLVGRDGNGGFTGIDLGTVMTGETAATHQSISLASGWKAEKCRLLIYVTQRIGDRYVCVNSAYAPIDGMSAFAYDQSNNSTDSYVKFDQNLYEYEYTGGLQSIEYELTGDADLDKLTVSTDAPWIKNLAIEGPEITFTLDKNNASASRQGYITVQYGDARPIDVSIRQKAEQLASNQVFNIDVEVVSPYAVNVTYTPTDFTGNYLFLVAKAETIDSYIEAGNLDGWMEEDIEWLESLAAARGASLADFLMSYKQVYAIGGETKEMRYSDLKPGTEYYAYCYGLTTDGQITTEFHKKKFTTEIVATVDLTFQAEVTDITQKSANIKIIPSNDQDPYYWTYVSEMDWAQYDIDFIMDNMIQNVLAYVQQGYNIMDIIHVGPSSEAAPDLWSGTKYYLVGWGMNEQGSPTTEAQQIGTFTTLSNSVVNDCTFDLEVTNVSDHDIQLHVTPSDDAVRYYIAMVDEEKCSGYNDEQMVQRIINMENNRFAWPDAYPEYKDKDWHSVSWTFNGEQTKWGREDLAWTFTPRHTYRIYVFGVEPDGTRNTEIFRIDQTTLPPAESNMTFKVEVVGTEWNYVTYKITPSTDDEYYMPFLVETSEMQYVTNPDGTIDEEELTHQITHYYDDSPNYYTRKGEQTIRMHWKSDTDYTLLLCGWAGGNTTPFYKYETHSPAIPFNESNADISYRYELIDVNDLIKLNPVMFEGFEDCVLIRIFVTPNEDADYYCYGVWMPESTYEDTGGKDHLLTLIQDEVASIVNRPIGSYRSLSYGVTYSLSLVAKDKDGRLGPWHYEEFTPIKDGDMMTPAYDWWTHSSPEAVQTFMLTPAGDVKEVKLPSFGQVQAEAASASRVASAPVKAKKSAKESDSIGRN